MKSSVNKLIIMVWCFCMASFVFADTSKDVKNPNDPGIKGINFVVPESDSESHRALVSVAMSGGDWTGEWAWAIPESSMGGGFYNGPLDLDAGTYTLLMGDSYGDSWGAGANITISYGNDILVSSGGPDGGLDCGSATTCVQNMIDNNPAYGWASASFDVPSVGCTDSTACNYNPNVTTDDGSCTYAAPNYDCAGDCTAALECDGVCGGSAALDSCGVCGGDDSQKDCAGTCSGTLEQGTFS